MTARMLGAISNPRTNVLGHCTGRMVMGNRGTRPSSEFDAKAVFEACGEHDVAVEINSRPERRDPPTKLHRARPRPRLPLLDRLRQPRARASSTSSTTAASAPRPPASSPTGSSTPGRATGSWPGPRRSDSSQRLRTRPSAMRVPRAAKHRPRSGIHTGVGLDGYRDLHGYDAPAGRGGTPVQAAPPDGLGLPRGRPDRGADPGQPEPPPGGRVGRDDGGPGREGRGPSPAQRRRPARAAPSSSAVPG